MATTGFWPVRGRLKEVLDYAENPDKTTAKEYLDDDLWNVLRYTENDRKTDRTMFVSGINCSKHNAYNEMIAVKRRFGERGKNIAYHGYQSFREGEVTPEEAHAIGVETARKMWGAKYQVIVTTHLNTENIHNHFVVNSVSFKDGRKFRNGIGDRMELRKISDAICAQRSKSVIQTHKFYGNKKEYWAKESGKLNHRDMLRQDLEEAVSQCSTFRDLERYLTGLGYRFQRDFRYEHPSVIAEGWQKAVRIDSLGERYEVGNLRDRMIRNQSDPNLYVIVIPNRKRTLLLALEYELRKTRNLDLVSTLFLLFIELLKLCIGNSAEQRKNRPLSPAMRAEVKKLDRYIEEYKLLCGNDIHTAQELSAFRDRLTAQIKELESQRYAVRLKLRRAKTTEEDAALKAQAMEITGRITPLRKQRQMTMDIENRSIPKINELLAQERKTELENNTRIKQKRSYER